MTSCPPPKQLEGLLGNELDDPTTEMLVDHLGECDSCRDALLEMSVEMEDWQAWESMLNPSLAWPSASGGQTSQLADTHALATAAIPSSNVPGMVAHERPREFADYEIFDKLGSGGMGIVYRARQKSTNRLVALKLIRPEQLEVLPDDRREAWLDRFRAEAQTAARLDHDHVVTIYDVGEQDGVLYYSMQYIEGPSLAQIVRDGPMENHRAAELMQCVSLAVDHAHRQGVLHRDLKPHNILVRRAEQSSAESDTHADSQAAPSTSSHAGRERPFVGDFGLAKCFEEGREGTTHTGEVMGSPSYMSPEQAKDSSRCTPASDIYGLGATLYEALTSRPPFRAYSALETLRQVTEQEPVAPRDLNPQIDLDLQTITLKALAKDPSRRYATAATMSNDLQRYLNGEPIEARPISRAERLLRWCRRNPMIASLGAGVTTLLLVVAVGSVVYSYQLREHARSESTARAEAEQYFRVTLNVIDEMLTEFGDESLAHVPQMEQARKDLLRKVIVLHQQLLTSKPSNTALRIDFARAQKRIGNLYDLLGDHDQAQHAFAEAIRLFTQLRNERPADHQLSHDLAVGYTLLGETLRETSPVDALRNYAEALKLQKQLQRSVPDDRDYTRELSRTLNNLGLLWTETGEFATAESALLEAIGHLKQLVASQSKHASDLADLGRSQINLGVLLRKSEDRATESEAAYRDAIANLERSVGLDKANRDNRFRLAVARFDLANFLLMNTVDRIDEALDLVSQANEVLGELRDDFPGIPVYRYELANSHSSMAITLAMQERTDDARLQFAQAGEVLEQLATDFPEYAQTVPKYQSLKGRVLGGTAYLRSLADDLVSAREHVAQAIVCQKEAARKSPDNFEFIEFLSQHHAFLATILHQLQLPREAAIAGQAADSFARQAADMKSRHEPN